ncbi:MAG TPA: TlpA disulfide reductase family protein [Candidatus Angelobacter sp.]|nr:TlpA disulfide reductase family protein [Candidatus Angelobacter sp.]
MLRECVFCLFLVASRLAGVEQIPAGPAQPQPAAIAAGEIGSRLPDFSARDLRGRRISSADLRGKVVLVDFWATWCQPCKKEMPGYQKLVDQYGSRGFAVIGFKLDIMADTEEPRAFARRLGIRYPLAVATDAVKNKFGGIEGLPTTLLYDRQGVLRQKIIGFEYTDVIEKALKALL